MHQKYRVWGWGLKQLWLQGMKAKTAFPLDVCPELECLRLTASSSAGQFRGVVLPALQELQIDKPTSNSVFPLSASPKVNELHLTNGELGDEWVREVASLENLTRLHLTDSPISPDQFRQLMECRSLEWLDLGGTRVGDKEAALLMKLDRLKILWIAHTAITDAAFYHLEALPLTHLNCGPFGRVGFRSVQKIGSLESLSVNGPVKERWRRKLEARGVRVWDESDD